jgi:hypothetical protein
MSRWRCAALVAAAARSSRRNIGFGVSAWSSSSPVSRLLCRVFHARGRGGVAGGTQCGLRIDYRRGRRECSTVAAGFRGVGTDMSNGADNGFPDAPPTQHRLHWYVIERVLARAASASLSRPDTNSTSGRHQGIPSGRGGDAAERAETAQNRNHERYDPDWNASSAKRARWRVSITRVSCALHSVFRAQRHRLHGDALRGRD